MGKPHSNPKLSHRASPNLSRAEREAIFSWLGPYEEAKSTIQVEFYGTRFDGRPNWIQYPPRCFACLVQNHKTINYRIKIISTVHSKLEDYAELILDLIIEPSCKYSEVDTGMLCFVGSKYAVGILPVDAPQQSGAFKRLLENVAGEWKYKVRKPDPRVIDDAARLMKKDELQRLKRQKGKNISPLKEGQVGRQRSGWKLNKGGGSPVQAKKRGYNLVPDFYEQNEPEVPQTSWGYDNEHMYDDVRSTEEPSAHQPVKKAGYTIEPLLMSSVKRHRDTNPKYDVPMSPKPPPAKPSPVKVSQRKKSPEMKGYKMTAPPATSPPRKRVGDLPGTPASQPTERYLPESVRPPTVPREQKPRQPVPRMTGPPATPPLPEDYLPSWPQQSTLPGPPELTNLPPPPPPLPAEITSPSWQQGSLRKEPPSPVYKKGIPPPPPPAEYFQPSWLPGPTSLGKEQPSPVYGSKMTGIPPPPPPPPPPPEYYQSSWPKNTMPPSNQRANIPPPPPTLQPKVVDKPGLPVDGRAALLDQIRQHKRQKVQDAPLPQKTSTTLGDQLRPAPVSMMDELQQKMNKRRGGSPKSAIQEQMEQALKKMVTPPSEVSESSEGRDIDPKEWQ